MVFYRRKRTTTARKPMAKRRPFNMKRRYVPKVFTFARYLEKDVRLGSDVTPQQDVGITFAMSDLNNSAEFTTLFDQYRIKKVLYRFYISRQVDLATTAANKGIYPRLFWVHDYDDSTPLAIPLLSEYTGMKSWQFNESNVRTKWMSISPAKLQEIYRATTSAYQPVWKGFLDTTYSNVPHYGVKFSIKDLYAGINLIMETKYIIELKNPR